MSQVIRKFDTGGNITKPKLFSVSGLGDYDQDDLVKQAYKGIDTYISSSGLNGKSAVNFKNAVQDMVGGIQNGTMTMNAVGDFNDSTGKASSTGELDRKKFLGIKTGIKDTENNAYALAGRYIKDLVNGMSNYTEPKQELSKFDTNKYTESEISKRWYGGNNIDWDNWFKYRSVQERNKLLSDIYNNTDYNDLYNKYDWKDTGINSAEDIATRGKSFSAALLNNKLDNADYNSFANLGGSNLNRFFNQTQPSTERTSVEDQARKSGLKSEEAISAYAKRAELEQKMRDEQQVADTQKKYATYEMQKYFDEYSQNNPFNSSVSGILPEPSYNMQGFANYLIKEHPDTNKYFNQLTSSYFTNKSTQQTASNWLDTLIKSGTKALPDAGDGFYAIPSTFNTNNWSTYLYNPQTRQYKESSLLANENLRKIASSLYNQKFKKADGGVIELQFGGTFDTTGAISKLSQQSNKKEEPVAKKPGENTRKPSDDWKWEDYTRLGSAAADIGSIVASFVPGYGTLTSAGLGVGSTLGNLTADIGEDGLQWKDLTNAGVGLGMDLVGLVPGLGAAGKGNKIARNILRYAPKLATMWSVGTSFKPALNALNKLQAQGTSSLTVDDWRALGSGISAAAGATRWGASAVRNKRMTNKFSTPYKTVTSKSGTQVKVTEDQLNQLKNAKGLGEQNKLFGSIAKGEELPAPFRPLYNPKKYLEGTPKVNKGRDYNINLERANTTGQTIVPTALSNEGIWKNATENSLGKSFSKPKFMENWGYKVRPTTEVPVEVPKVSVNSELKSIRTKTTAKNKRETINYWKARYPKRLVGKSNSEIQKIINEQKTANKKKEGGTLKYQNGGYVTSYAGTPLTSNKSKFNIIPEDVLALGRMTTGLAINNKAARVYKSGLKPTLLDTYENTVPLQGNFQAKSNAEQQANNLESIAAQPRTSDASFQLAGELDASNKAGQARMQGGMADADAFNKSRLLGLQESDAASARRVDVANRNRASMNAIGAAKKQIDASKITANYQQVFAPWLAGVENTYQQKAAARQQLIDDNLQNQASIEYQTEYNRIIQNEKDPVKRDQALINLRNKATSNKMNNRSKIIGSPWLIQFNKEGAKLTYEQKQMLEDTKEFNKRLSEDNKQFHKDIENSKREHTKLIMNMSSLTAALIRKGMQV